jgi:hypothetical protein
MSITFGPQTSKTLGLIGNWDAGNPKSFQGEPVTNILNQVSPTVGNQQSANIRVASNTQQVFIPTVNKTVNCRVINFYNNYGPSGNCCPNLFTYGTGLSVSGNTQYTYSIIYKTTTGYTHPNYMYRYEYGPSGYLTEGGVHNDANRTSLGDGWYHAWGQFTSQPTVTSMNTYFFHYEYNTFNTVYLASAQLTAGSRVIPAKDHIFNVETGSNRSNAFDINAFGTSNVYNRIKSGGFLDTSGFSAHGVITNGPTYDTDGGGCMVFDGSNDGIQINEVSNLAPPMHTISAWVKSSNFNQSGFIFEKTTNGSVNTQWSLFFNGNNTTYYRTMGLSSEDLIFTTSSYFTNNQWNHVIATYDGGTKRVYVNGVQATSQSVQGALGSNNTGPAYIGIYGSFSGYPFNGKIAKVQVYDRPLTATEVLNDYNNTKSRFGL